MYPQLLKVQKEMSGLRLIYDIYQDLKVHGSLEGCGDPQDCGPWGHKSALCLWY
jgi:hypothetical protein